MEPLFMNDSDSTESNQAIWMDMALGRRSGQELRNSYVITKSTEQAPLRRFFKAAVNGFADGVRQISGDIRPAEVAASADAGGSGKL